MAWKSDHPLFRSLTDEEELEMRVWARDNYELLSEINALWHPVVREECNRMNDEHLRDSTNSFLAQIEYIANEAREEA